MSLTRAYSGGGLDANVNLGQMQEAASKTDVYEAAMTDKKAQDDAVAAGMESGEPIITPAQSSTSSSQQLCHIPHLIRQHIHLSLFLKTV